MTAFDNIVAGLVVSILLISCVRYTRNTFHENTYNHFVHLQASATRPAKKKS